MISKHISDKESVYSRTATRLNIDNVPTQEHKENMIKLAEEIFKSAGVTCWLEEKSLDQYTALIGSGPAYVFYVIEALMEASKGLDIKEEDIKRLLIDMIIGSSELAKISEDEPSILRKKVTSPGGVTQRAIEVLEENKTKETIINAIKEATKRSIDLGNK